MAAVRRIARPVDLGDEACEADENGSQGNAAIRIGRHIVLVSSPYPDNTEAWTNLVRDVADRLPAEAG
jgi:hypothetical protein